MVVVDELEDGVDIVMVFIITIVIVTITLKLIVAKAREQQRKPWVVVVAQSDITKYVIIHAVDYNDFLQFKAAHQPSSSSFVSTSSIGLWILDSGAYDHMTGNKSILSHLSYSDSFPSVTVADGSKIKVHGLGQAHSLPNLSLEYILYISGCPFNLIYVHKLTHTLDCSLIFNDKSVYVQNRRT